MCTNLLRLPHWTVVASNFSTFSDGNIVGLHLWVAFNHKRGTIGRTRSLHDEIPFRALSPFRFRHSAFYPHYTSAIPRFIPIPRFISIPLPPFRSVPPFRFRVLSQPVFECIICDVIKCWIKDYYYYYQVVTGKFTGSYLSSEVYHCRLYVYWK